VKLFESPEFRDAIQAAKEHFGHVGLTEQLIEKDYYVTEALRIVAERWPTQVIFKGGTTLSKGWRLIERFSEDIDIFLNRAAFEPPLGSSRVDRELKDIRDAVNTHLGLKYSSIGSFSDRGTARKDYFEYHQIFPGIASVANRILLEAGTRSGDYPIERVKLSSYLAEFLETSGESLGADDESSFSMQLLDYRRTFVEKLFTIHSKVEQSLQEGSTIGTLTFPRKSGHSRRVDKLGECSDDEKTTQAIHRRAES
jgi:Nucleotidyl transferase AbiEii toxin, Type IV TA system